MIKSAMWLVTLVVGVAMVAFAGAWLLAVVGAGDRLLGLYREAEGWRRGYLFAGSVVGSFAVYRVAGRGVGYLRRAAERHDRPSAVIEVAGVLPFLLAAGLIVGIAAGLLWPVAVPVLVLRSLRRHRRDRERVRDEARELREQIEGSGRG